MFFPVSPAHTTIELFTKEKVWTHSESVNLIKWFLYKRIKQEKKFLFNYHGRLTCIKYCDVGPLPEVLPHPVAVANFPV